MICLLTARVAIHASGLPFTIENPDGDWKTSAVNRDLAQNIKLEAVIIHSTEKVRFIVVSSPPTGEAVEAPAAFAVRIRESFSTAKISPVPERDETDFGYPGHVTHFEVQEAGETYACVLFTFTLEKSSWGVLYISPKDAPAHPGSPFKILHKAALVPVDVVGMPAFKVKEDAVTGFPISLGFSRDPKTGRITKIVVTEVPSSSSTERAGVLVGDEVLSVDGRKSQDFPVGVTKNSELGKIFLNRRAGDKVKLEIVTPNPEPPAGSPEPAEPPKSRIVTLFVPQSRSDWR
jgi:hypothetical protein